MHGTRGAADAATGFGTTGLSAALLLIADSRLPAGGHAHSGGAEEAVHVGAIAGPEDLARFLRGRLATTGLVAAALSAAACHLAATIGDQVKPRRESAVRDGIFRPSPADGASDAESRARGRAPARESGTTRAASPGDTPPAGDASPEESAGLWGELDAEADARTPSPAMRTASRTQGRLLVRSARRIWPSAVLDGLALALPEGAHHPVALGAVACAAGCPPRDAALAAAYNAITGPATAAVRLLGLDPVTVHRLLADLSPELDGTATAAVAAVNDALVGEMGVPPQCTEPLGRTPAADDTISVGVAGQRDTRETGESPEPTDRPGGTASDHGHARDFTSREDASPGSRIDDVAHDHTIRYDWAALPSCGAPALDLLAEGHLRREVRLFVS
ncbi:urease accessory UreF family protein [Thermopolyspora sp. NPDC052614]|uniref:urease accessory protein UreF n=1 Tax=Thermopolyspora sp. NPDC052614 TaxID=3155682 RepID=UPI003442E51C